VRFLERKVLPQFLRKSRWFGSKTQKISEVIVEKIIPIKTSAELHYFFIVDVHYVQRLPELYFLPVSFAGADVVFESGDYNTQSIWCRADFQGKPGFLIDSIYDRGFRDFIFQSIDRKIKIKEEGGTIEFDSGIYAKLDAKNVESKVLKNERSNSAIVYNDQFFFKFYRKVEREINPDMEIVRFLSENTSFKNSPRYAGSITFIDNEGLNMTLGLLQEKIESQGDSWAMATDSVGRFYERVMTNAKKEKVPKLINKSAISFEEAPELVQELIGRGFYERVARLGQRTAEMHLALASDNTNPDFASENFTPNYQRSLYSSLRKLTRDCMKLLKQSMDRLDSPTQTLAKEVLNHEDQMLECFSAIQKERLSAKKIRIHGDLHLGQVIFTGKDFVINDFEGQHEISFNERRLKKSPFRDLATMMRSFHYAAFGKILLNENYREKDIEFLSQWAELWQHYVNRFFMDAYLERSGMNKDLSEDDDTLMFVFLLEKAIDELSNEINTRLHWAGIPLRGILYQLNRWEQSKKTRVQKA
jgi:maltose alpha-D-glucosyltransferase/alpha-amylase